MAANKKPLQDQTARAIAGMLRCDTFSVLRDTDNNEPMSTVGGIPMILHATVTWPVTSQPDNAGTKREAPRCVRRVELR